MKTSSLNYKTGFHSRKDGPAKSNLQYQYFWESISTAAYLEIVD